MTTRHILAKGAEMNDEERKALDDRFAAQRTDLEGLRTQLNDAKARAVDFIADTRETMLVPIPAEGEATMPEVAEVDRNVPQRPRVAMVPRHCDDAWYSKMGPVAINAHAHGQIRAHLKESTRNNGGKPSLSMAWYKWMLVNEPDMFCLTVNRLFERSADRRMFRVLLGDDRFGDGHARAYLSDKYRRMDFVEYVDHVIFPELENDTEGWQADRCGLTDLRSHVELILPTMVEEIAVGDTVALALKLTGSDVGSGAIDFSVAVQKLECTNLWISETVHRKIHVGARQDNLLEELLSDETKALDDKVIFAKLRDAMRSLKSREYFDRFIDAARETNRGEVNDPVAACELLTENVGLNVVEAETLQTRMLTEGNMSPWGMMNALTSVARDSEYERKAELEKAAGRLLVAKPADWRPYREAERVARIA